MDDVLEAIRTLLDAASLGYKKIYYGENEVPALQHYPFIEVDGESTDITNKGTGGLKNNVYAITINFKHHMKKKFKANTDRQIIQHKKDLVKAMEERNSDGTAKDGTIMQVLEDNLQLSNTVDINGNWHIDYEKSTGGEHQIITAVLTFEAMAITPR